LALPPSKRGRLPFPGPFQLGDPLLELGHLLLQRRILGLRLLQLRFQFGNPLVPLIRWRRIWFSHWMQALGHEAIANLYLFDSPLAPSEY